MTDNAIKVENLSKRYRLGGKQERYRTMRDTVVEAVQAPFRRAGKLLRGEPYGAAEMDDTIWALKDVSFEVERGEVVGIIGRNGAGKTTLLKILSRITEPTAGRAEIHGRVGSLLEVGTGFHPELTGRENIYLNGAILGMTKAEIERKFDEIVAFSGVEKFIDTPVKHYSSGMRVRLAFSVAAHLNPEILLIDEVLAVGDAAFQKKCLAKMDDVSRGGRTVFLVSHNMGMIRSLCHRAILLEEGCMVLDTNPDEAIAHYLSSGRRDDLQGEVYWDDLDKAPGGDQVRLRSVRLLGPDGAPQDTFDLAHPITVEIIYRVLEPVRGMRLVLQVITQAGSTAFASTDHNQRGPEAIRSGLYRAECTIPARLLNKNRYYVRLNAGIPGVKVLLPGEEFISFTTVASGAHGSHFNEQWPGVVAPALDWKTDERLT